MGGRTGHSWIAYSRCKKKAIRLVSNVPYTTPSRPLFESLGVLSCHSLFAMLLTRLIAPRPSSLPRPTHGRLARFSMGGNLLTTTYKSSLSRKTPIPIFCLVYSSLPHDTVRNYVDNIFVCRDSFIKYMLRAYFLNADSNEILKQIY